MHSFFHTKNGWHLYYRHLTCQYKPGPTVHISPVDQWQSYMIFIPIDRPDNRVCPWRLRLLWVGAGRNRSRQNHVTSESQSRHNQVQVTSEKGEIRLKYKEVRRMVCRKQRPSTHAGPQSGPSSRNDSALLWLLFNHVTRFNDLSHVTAVMWRCLPSCVSLLTELVNL